MYTGRAATTTNPALKLTPKARTNSTVRATHKGIAAFFFTKC